MRAPLTEREKSPYPGGMDAQDYADALRPLLAAHTDDAAARLERFHRAAVEAGAGIDAVLIDVFVDQDAEGPFDVWARFEGRDAFLLDRRFDDDRHLFGVEWGEDGWEPDVPPRPRGWIRDDLERAALDAVVEWLSPRIPPGAPDGFWRIGIPGGADA